MTQPLEKGGVPPIEIYTIVGPDRSGLIKPDPVEEQDSKNEDDEFKRIEQEQKQREKYKQPSAAIWP
jgi:hypothetical protein